MTPDEFKRQLDKLLSVIKGGIAYFSAWRGLRDGDAESVQALNRYPGFFLPTHNALVWMALIQFAKVFDRDPRTVSLRNLLAAAKKDRTHLTPHATEDDLNQIEQQIDANKALLERLERVRDQLIAHHDAIALGDKSLPYGEVRQLVEDIKAWYNSLRHGHDMNVTSFELILEPEAQRHTSEVVRVMREERDRAVRRISGADMNIPNG